METQLEQTARINRQGSRHVADWWARSIAIAGILLSFASLYLHFFWESNEIEVSVLGVEIAPEDDLATWQVAVWNRGNRPQVLLEHAIGYRRPGRVKMPVGVRPGFTFQTRKELIEIEPYDVEVLDIRAPVPVRQLSWHENPNGSLVTLGSFQIAVALYVTFLHPDGGADNWSQEIGSLWVEESKLVSRHSFRTRPFRLRGFFHEVIRRSRNSKRLVAYGFAVTSLAAAWSVWAAIASWRRLPS